jgi:hypothetical protein
MIKGNKKCKLKKRFKVALLTENPPHNHIATESPTKGIAVNKLVITVAPQKLICPQGRTYPKKAVAIVKKNNKIPEYHNAVFL